MKKILIIILLLVGSIGLAQPNPPGKGKGLDNPKNPNYSNPVPISGVEFLIVAGIILGGFTIYKKNQDANNRKSNSEIEKQ